MRLINCKTMQLEEYFGKNIPPYAILSHTWGDDEVTFVDLPLDNPTTKAKGGYQKIYYTCGQATSDGVKYAWVDTCCIDKRSSSELSEAINSMFAWYRNARHCYAYLSDVSVSKVGEQFRKSRWFTRGWTLQELLAPGDIVFYNRQWNKLGQKSKDADLIADITRIDAPALMTTSWFGSQKNNAFGTYCVAKRMSWASRRETTRIEDMAYCLLGIFDVSMPLLYGEGNRAFRRLQEEIIRVIGDDSILAWGLIPDAGLCVRSKANIFHGSRSYSPFTEGILALSPRDFENCGDLERSASSKTPFTLTNVGLKIELPVLTSSHQDDMSSCSQRIAILSCSIGNTPGMVGILLRTREKIESPPKSFYRAKCYIKPHVCSSLVMSLRDVVNAVSSMVLIEEFDGGSGLISTNPSYRQVVVNASENLQNRGYNVRKTTYWSSWSTQGVFVIGGQWFPEEMMLTLGNYSSRDIMIGFCFESMQETVNPTFTVFMRPDRSIAIACEGSIFSDDDYARCFRYLHQKTSQQHHRDLILLDGEGEGFRIGTWTRLVTIHGREIAELNVSADTVSKRNDSKLFDHV